MTPLRVTAADARRALIHHQLGPGSLDEVARRLGSVQVDPLAPMGRNHDLVLQARVDGYRIDDWQGPAYRDRTWVDAWDKQACLTLAVDWPARRLYRDRVAARSAGWLTEHADAVAATLARIETEGPCSSLGFPGGEHAGLRGSWFGPRLVQHVLRVLWHTGRLVTREREAGRHVYDLPERVLPAAVLAAPPLDDDAALRILLRRRVQSAGVLRRGAGVALWSLPIAAATWRAALAELVAEGKLDAWEVDGVPYLALPGLRDAAADGAADGAGRVDAARVLGPLDNLTWDRRALRDLFAFDYLWEVYKPAAQRRWGYYVVPVVLGDRFVARFDGRREATGAASARLRLHGWWWEEPRPGAAAELEGLRRGLARFLRYLGADGVALPRGLDRATRALWHGAAAEAAASAGA